MKKLLLLIAAFGLFSGLVSAQDPEFEYYKSQEIRTLFGKDRTGGVYGSFTAGYSTIDNKNALLFGGRFSWIANHSFGIGIGAMGFVNEYHYDANIDKDVFLAGGYGGLYLEPIIFPRSPIHLSFPILFGAGGVSYVSDNYNYDSNFVEDSEAFLIIEPSAELELNLTKFCRLAFGVSYRLPSSFDVGLSGSPIATAKSLKGISYGVTFKFGKF
jgi:hypothetical protein